MRTRRRIVAVLIAALVLATVVACGRFGGNDTNPRQDEKRDSAPAIPAPPVVRS